MSGKKSSHVREQLVAAQYFEAHNIRQHFTTLTQMLMIHQPSDPLRFMQEELGRLIAAEDNVRDKGYSSAVADGACFVRVQAQYEGPEGTRKRTFTRLLPAGETSIKHRAEMEAMHTLHSVFWAADECPPEAGTMRQVYENRLDEIAEEERLLEPGEHATVAPGAGCSPACSPGSRAEWLRDWRADVHVRGARVESADRGSGQKRRRRQYRRLRQPHRTASCRK